MSPLEILVAPSADDLAASVAAMLAARIVEAQSDGGRASVVLTGGRIGTQILHQVAVSPSADAIDWRAIDLWWGDERYLPADDPDRNDTGAWQALLSHVDVDPVGVHAIAGPDESLDAPDAAAQYADALASAAALDGSGDVPHFDVVLLSMGPDGHVASLFPEAPAVHETAAAVVSVHGSPKPPPTRVTLTFRALNNAQEIWLLASGEEKQTAVRLLLDGSAGAAQIPAAGVHGLTRTCVLLDAAAAAVVPVELRRPLA